MEQSNKPTCKVHDCGKPEYSIGYCKNHRELLRRNGVPDYKKNLPGYNKKCSVDGCENIGHYQLGLCPFHRLRKYKGVQLSRPKGVKGELNCNWKGGVSEYKNHYEMKKTRKIVLEEENYTCFICGKTATDVHHLDGTKWNHERSNLRAACRSCHTKIPHKSVYTRLYGKKISDIVRQFGIPYSQVRLLHGIGFLKSVIDLKQVLDKSLKT